MPRCVHCGTFEADLTSPNVMLEMRDDEGNAYHICENCEAAGHETEDVEGALPELLPASDVQDEEQRQWFADPAESSARPDEGNL
ncbi:MAG: hypothetical protein M3Y28_08580 [Armatimonadota bacterium]|nr:hypothetical protein [Armatimonadota bacterium]